MHEFFNPESGAIKKYKTDRNRPDKDGTSRLSAHFKFGNISTREAYYQAGLTLDEVSGSEAESVIAWQDEIIWREFYFQILMNFPKVQNGNFKEKYDDIEWEDNPEYFEAWKSGETGYPFIDASMRQLNETGWMHNRGRMAVAMFLTKDLHIHWKKGEEYFATKLIDLDIASNNGGWQWSASTGTDAAPYFRIFNPVSQGEKCDPRGDYVRKWVPELSEVEGKKVHKPWDLNDIDLEYPERIVDHSKERKKALEEFKSVS
jgi:deoxyribodipyrimidine photo-lyase